MSLPYAYTPQIWPPAFTALVLIALAIYSFRRRSVPGTLPFAFALSLGALWMVGISLEVAAIVSVSAPSGWTCKYASGKVSCTGASLASGSSATIQITVTVNKTARIGKELVNNAAVSSAMYDPVMANNTVVQKTLVIK